MFKKNIYKTRVFSLTEKNVDISLEMRLARWGKRNRDKSSEGNDDRRLIEFPLKTRRKKNTLLPAAWPQVVAQNYIVDKPPLMIKYVNVHLFFSLLFLLLLFRRKRRKNRYFFKLNDNNNNRVLRDVAINRHDRYALIIVVQ